MRTKSTLSFLLFLFCSTNSLFSQKIFEQNDIVYLYDSATPGYAGLEADDFYAMVCEFLPEGLNVVPVEMADVDGEGLSSLDKSAGIIISDTGNDRGEDDPLVARLGELYNTHPMLCLNTTFPTRWPFYSYRPAYFEVEKEETGNFAWQGPMENQSSLFDDVLSAADGLTRIYEPSVVGMFNLAHINFSLDMEDLGAFTPLGIYDWADAGFFGITDRGIMLLGGSTWRFLYLGLCQSMMNHLSVTGKNLVRNAVRFLADGELYARKPHLTKLIVNGIPASAEEMCELSTGETTIHLPSKDEWDCIEDIEYDFAYANGCRPSFYNHFTYFDLECEYGNSKDTYKVYYVFDHELAIDELSADEEDAPSYDLMGRKQQGANGLNIEHGKIVFKQ